MTDEDTIFMNEALKEASSCGIDVPIGCVIVHRGKIIGRGANQRERNQDPIGHAEMFALREAASHLNSWRLLDTVIYTTLEPCPMCAEALIQARVGRVVFGAYEPISGAAGSAFNLFVNRKNVPIPGIRGGVLQEECAELLVNFFKDQRQNI